MRDACVTFQHGHFRKSECGGLGLFFFWWLVPISERGSSVKSTLHSIWRERGSLGHKKAFTPSGALAAVAESLLVNLALLGNSPLIALKRMWSLGFRG